MIKIYLWRIPSYLCCLIFSGCCCNTNVPSLISSCVCCRVVFYFLRIHPTDKIFSRHSFLHLFSWVINFVTSLLDPYWHVLLFHIECNASKGSLTLVCIFSCMIESLNNGQIWLWYYNHFHHNDDNYELANKCMKGKH